MRAIPAEIFGLPIREGRVRQISGKRFSGSVKNDGRRFIELFRVRGELCRDEMIPLPASFPYTAMRLGSRRSQVSKHVRLGLTDRPPRRTNPSPPG